MEWEEWELELKLKEEFFKGVFICYDCVLL